MARIRTIKPEFFRSRSLAKCSRDARTTFQGLWAEADDAGRGIADARILKGSIWPLDDDLGHEDVERHLHELADTGHIKFYEVDGERYYLIINWEKHQAAAYRRGEPVHPAPPWDAPHDDACKEVQDARVGVLEGKGREGNEEGEGNDPAPLGCARELIAVWESLQPGRKHTPSDLANVLAVVQAGHERPILLEVFRETPKLSPGALQYAVDKAYKAAPKGPRRGDPAAILRAEIATLERCEEPDWDLIATKRERLESLAS